jgi:MmeI, DNA-methyltransferase domain
MPAVRVLSSSLRKQLETAVLGARRAAESASKAAIDGLGAFDDRRPEHLDADQAGLRNGLRAKWRQFGADRELLISECAYEQWHRLLFARFLAENDLLLHPRYRAPVTLADCEELAAELGEPDGWSVAARFAAEILPGIFRLDDPCVRLRLAPEGRHALETILDGLPTEVFAADDALGWVYQFWQKDKKDEVNASERKIGGADLGPVTQLFTENYMVRFLLENSLGAWWADRHPDSSLVKGFEYLRFDDDGKPAAGSFDTWPDRIAEVTVMDPCCGSGHFLVEAFSMLWQMRAEAERLSPIDAQDAVLRDNLFGLELDPRCVQIAMFAVALHAWKAGSGWRQLPVPNIACSGIPVKASAVEWTALAGGDPRLEEALGRLHLLSRNADTLGSLIDPKQATVKRDPNALQTSFEDVEWVEVVPLLARAASAESEDPTTVVLGASAASSARAIDFLNRTYSLIATNVPYLKRAREDTALREFTVREFPRSSADLGVVFFERILRGWSITVAAVTPTAWTTATSFTEFRRALLRERDLHAVAFLGAGAFGSISGEVVNVTLAIVGAERMRSRFSVVPAAAVEGPGLKADALRKASIIWLDQDDQIANPDSRILVFSADSSQLLSLYARAYQGLATGDYPRYGRKFWEIPEVASGWELQQSTVRSSALYAGREHVVLWEDGEGALSRSPAARVQGLEAWSKKGVAVSQMGMLPATLYCGEIFDNNTSAVVPVNEALLPAIWAFLRSPEYGASVRAIDDGIKVTNATLVKVPFDIDRWRQAAEAAGALAEPWSNDPTQWLFDGRSQESTAPLQAAVGRLVGYRWPKQAHSGELDPFADTDGIVSLPSVAGEAPAADRLQQVLAAAFGEAWSPARMKEMLEVAGSPKNIADWLCDEFFKQHCALFGNRPFVWHIWDGRRDGFSALVNYHKLDRKALEKLTFTYLGQDWVERQRAEVRDEVAGAEARLSAALELRRKLELIIVGEKPYDIYVRWKKLEEQPVGWEPDLNDGVRLNIRPFVEAGVLRTPFNIHWKKDRGTNPDGTERHNDIHLSLAEKTEARTRAGRA